MTNEHTSLEKYTSLTLFLKGLRKGWYWLCVRGELEMEQTASYWPQLPLYYSSTSSSFCWAAQLGSWGTKPSVWHWLSLRNLVSNCDWNSNCDSNLNWTLPASNSNWLKPSVAPGYIIVWRPTVSCGHTRLYRIQQHPQVSVIFWYLRPDTPASTVPLLITQVHLLIDSSVEGQYVTTVQSLWSSHSATQVLIFDNAAYISYIYIYICMYTPGLNPRSCHTKDFKNGTWYLLA